MNFIIRVASVNLNSSSSLVNRSLLKDFIFSNDLDVIFLQEVCYSNFSFVPSFVPFVNLNERDSGTAILVRNSLNASQPLFSLNGRVTSIAIENMNFVNVYAFSGANRRKERDDLFLNDLTTHLAKANVSKNIVGGDFNCIINSSDCVGDSKNYCTGLRQLIDAFKWKDVAWELKKNQFTFHRLNSASRLDRFYVPTDFINEVLDFKTEAVTFSDHCGIIMKIKVDRSMIVSRGRGYWKINPTILRDERVSEQFAEACETWKLRQVYNIDKSKWWNEVFKTKSKQFYKSKSWDLITRITNEKQYFYGKIREYMEKKNKGEETYLDIKVMKSRILEIETDRLNHLGSTFSAQNLLQGEIINIFQIAAQIKRHEQSSILKLKDNNIVVNDSVKLKRMVFEYYSEQFKKEIVPNPDDISDPLNYLTNFLDDDDREQLISPITLEELKRVLELAKKKKSPGPDGLTYEFYLQNFEVMKDDMLEIFNAYLSGALLPPKGFSDGVITLIPKNKSSSLTLDDYRPISMLNCDYKLFTKILAERVQSKLHKLLGIGQTACLQNTSCVDNLKDIRRIFTRSCENKRFKGCLVSIDLNKAFDRVDHEYLWKILNKFGFPRVLIDCVKNLYSIASSRVLVNGFLTDQFNIKRSVRQGCPLSMVLFVLYLEPLVRNIAENLQGFWVYDKFIKVIVFADDFNVIVRSDQEFDSLLEIFECYSKYARIKINVDKSSFVRLNKAQLGPQKIKEVDNVKILGVKFHKTWNLTVVANYDSMVTHIKATMQKHKIRNTNLYERCIILNTFILSKIWYVAQIFPPLNRHIAEIKKICGNFIWHGLIFRVERNQLYLDYLKGGLRLIDPEAKMKALFIKNLLYNENSNGCYIEEKYLLDFRMPQRLTKKC